MNGRRLLGGRYEVGEVIGRGGMADVHLGFDTRLSRPVAIKLLRSDLAREGSFLTRFQREARSAAGLNHPAIVAIFDSGEDHPVDAAGHEQVVPYIVMEVVEGQTLRERLHAHGPLPPEEAARITEGVLAALAYSHRMGIVHRDIKPANVMITPTGDIKVMDFGIARAIADTAATMTQTQAVVGTAQYLSPEQAKGQQVDARSDLYSTGCMLFELLTGRTPFVGDTPVSIAYQHVGEAPQPPSTVRAGVPAAYDAIVLHAMAKDREVRYQQANDFRADLICAREGRPISAEAAGAIALTTAPATTVLTPVPDPHPRGSRRGDTGEIETIRYAAPPEPERRRRWVPWLIAGIVLALVAAGLWFGRGLLQPAKAEQVAVPYVVTKTEGEARTLIEGKRLLMKAVPVKDATVASGTVVEQNPQQGTMVDLFSTVEVKVSTGPGESIVPPVTGLSKADAMTAIANAGFAEPLVVVVDDPSQPKDVAVSTDPVSGARILVSKRVTLNISSGKVKLPKLVGQPSVLAQQTVAGLKLAYKEERRSVTDPAILEGTVLEQTPPPDSLVDQGSEVKVVIAIRAVPTTTVVVTTTIVPPPPPPPSTTPTTATTTTTTTRP